MTAFPRRGACPSLSAPMQTGDGLLARLSPADGELSPAQMAGIAHAAARHGNGLLEITARGNLQIRGLTQATVEPLGTEVAVLNIAARSGIAVETGPLAGLDAKEIADPRPLAERIRGGAATLEGRLAPKVSVTVDGGGALPLRGILADVKLVADADGWRVFLGSEERKTRDLGLHDAEDAAKVTMMVLEALADGTGTKRARDLDADSLARLGLELNPVPAAPEPYSALPVGSFALSDGAAASGFALPFGQTDSDTLNAFCDAARDAKAIRLARGRGLLVIGLPANQQDALAETATRLGLVTSPDDPRLAIVACAGAPACRSARLATKAIAAAIVKNRTLLPPLNISGCPKGCSAPSGTVATLVGTINGCVLQNDKSLDPALRNTLLELGQIHFLNPGSA